MIWIDIGGVRAQVRVRPYPSAPVNQIVTLEAEVHQQEARISFMKMQLEQAEMETRQQDFLLKDVHRRAEVYMSHMTQRVEAFQSEETRTREDNQRHFEQRCEQHLHQGYEQQMIAQRIHWQQGELLQIQQSVAQEKEQCQVLENQMLQVALGKQPQSLEEKQQQHVRELRQHLQHSHELALQQAQQETQAEGQMADLWKELAQKQGTGVQPQEE